jgi:6-phosphogluconolactonase
MSPTNGGWGFLMIATMLWLGLASSFGAETKTELVYVGSGKKDIYAFRMDLGSGALTPLGRAAEIVDPSFFSISPDRHFLYAVTEGSSAENSFISAFQIQPETGKLIFLNKQLTGGAGPCFVEVDQRGKDALVANYNSGSLSVFPINDQGNLGQMSAFIQDQGAGPNRQRQEGPHAHCIVTGPADRFVFACDLGLDKVMIFKFDPEKGSLVANDPAFAVIKPGSGPRHIAFHPNGQFAYVISEMSSTLTVMGFDLEHGALHEIETHSLLPNNFKGNSSGAEVAVHPSGKFVFGSNRGDDSIAVFRCDPATGQLTFLERDSTLGKFPRHFEIDPSGMFLLAANQNSGSVVVFSIDSSTGHLKPTGNKIAIETPMCVKCLPE